MVIDIHTHAFPDALAPKAISLLTANAHDAYNPVHDGTIKGLKNNMLNWGVDISVIQPVITKLSQTKHTNDWARSLCSESIISFGGIYPHSENYKNDIDCVVSLGLKGLKFHAEFQDFIIDDEYMLKIYDYAINKGLIIMQHAGSDPAFPPPCKSSPRQFAKISKMLGGGIIIAAHLGGHGQWDEVEEFLVGSNIYLDTSMGFDYYSEEQFLRIVKNHGTEKILFGSDSPWSNADKEIKHLRALPLSENELNSILYLNAKRILKI